MENFVGKNSILNMLLIREKDRPYYIYYNMSKILISVPLQVLFRSAFIDYVYVRSEHKQYN